MSCCVCLPARSCLPNVAIAEIAKIAVEFGMERIEQLTCVKFREKNDSDDHFIYITSDKGYDSLEGTSIEVWVIMT